MRLIRWLLVDHGVLTGAATSLVLVLLLTRGGRLDDSGALVRNVSGRASATSWRAAGTVGVAFCCICLLSRLVFSRVMFDSWYLQDDAFDTCVKPLQLRLGLPIWGRDTGLLMYPLYSLLGEIAGANVQVTNGVTAAVFCASLAAAVVLAARAHGLAAGLVMGLLLTVSYPFVMHSVYSSAIAWAAPGAMIGGVWLLTRQVVTPASAAALGAAAIVSLYMYPGATVAVVALAGAHRLVLGTAWRRGAALIFLASLAASYFLAQLLVSRLSLGIPVVRTQFAGGRLFLDPHAISQALWIYLREPFLRTASWDALNLDGPYFEPACLWMLALALYARHRLTVVAASALVIAGLLASFLGPYPGIRRTMWVLPALYFALAAYLAAVMRARRPQRVRMGVAVGISVGLIGLRSWAVADFSAPLTRPNPFVVETEKWLATAGQAVEGRTLVLVENDMDQYRSHQYWCYLTFRQRAARADNPIQLVSTSPVGPPRYPWLVSDAPLQRITPPFLLLLQKHDSPALIPRLWPDARTVDIAYASASTTGAEGAPPALRVYRVE